MSNFPDRQIININLLVEIMGKFIITAFIKAAKLIFIIEVLYDDETVSSRSIYSNIFL